jgi:hypothetical protein
LVDFYGPEITIEKVIEDINDMTWAICQREQKFEEEQKKLQRRIRRTRNPVVVNIKD